MGGKSDRTANWLRPVVRTDPRSFGEQIAEMIRRAIASRVFRAGEPIPGLRSIAADAGVSVRAVREAVRILEQEGAVVARQGLGCLVQRRTGLPVHRGNVLIVVSGGADSVYQNIVVGQVGDRLQEIGWSASHYIAHRMAGDHLDVSRLQQALAMKPDFVFSLTTKDVGNALAASGVPWAVAYHLPVRFAGCVGRMWHGRSEAVTRMVRRCVQKSVRTVLVVALDVGFSFEREKLEAAGIAVEMLLVRRVHSRECSLFLRKGAYDGVRRRLLRKDLPRPDLVYFADDGVAYGGFLAVAELGIRIPQDMKLATLSLAGISPVFSKPVSRIEVDPFAVGDAYADAIIRYLRTGRFPSDVSVEAKWVEGETL